MRTETSVRSMRRDGEVWVHAGDVANFMTTQRRVTFEKVDDRGHQIFSWLCGVFEQIASGQAEVVRVPAPSRPPTTEELQQDLIVLRSELREGHG